jgi:hypoxanthine-DNA glycosylase
MTHRKTSFDPIADERTSVLIPGTIPGDRSLELGEYYGHPRNRFWRTIATITGNPIPETYLDKKSLLLRSGIGLWDVVHNATREGSLDSAIRDEEPNDVVGLIATHPNTKVVGFNGRTAEKLYDRYFDRLPGIAYIPLLSTSPANAAVTFEALCEKWREIFIVLNDIAK